MQLIRWREKAQYGHTAKYASGIGFDHVSSQEKMDQQSKRLQAPVRQQPKIRYLRYAKAADDEITQSF